MNENLPNISTEGGVFIRNAIRNGSSTVHTPTKAIPIDKLEEDESVLPSVQNVAERYAKLHSGHLENFERYGDLRKLERQDSNPGSYDVVIHFFGYTDAFPLSKEKIQSFVKLSQQYSDIMTPPIQVPLLEMILYPERADQPRVDGDDDAVENTSEPDYFHLYKTGIERYLEVVEGSDEPVAAPIPFLKDHYLDVLNLVSTIIEHEADIDMWCYNMLRRKPTNRQNRNYILAMHNLLRRHGAFTPTLKYAINVRHSYKEDENIRSAEDLLLAGFGFDIIGENHWSPPQAGSYHSEMEVRLFDKDFGAYRSGPPTQSVLDDIWTSLEDSSFDKDSILRAANDDDLGRVQKPINAERLETLLSELRGDIVQGTTLEFSERHEGVRKYLNGSLQAMAENWNQSDSQSTMREHT